MEGEREDGWIPPHLHAHLLQTEHDSIVCCLYLASGCIVGIYSEERHIIHQFELLVGRDTECELPVAGEAVYPLTWL